jgi:isoquinoline 1-oxidoreductase alpha subunit
MDKVDGSDPVWTIEVNGRSFEVRVPGDTPLLWVLREELALKGTKFGCGRGLCGSCTVHVSGEPARSCVLPIAAAQGQPITTIEGLSPASGKLHPVQQAWIEGDVPQCGYCQSGQIMSAAALLAKNSQPSAAEIRTAMAGNICRCGSYPQILRSIEAAAERLRKDPRP